MTSIALSARQAVVALPIALVLSTMHERALAQSPPEPTTSSDAPRGDSSAEQRLAAMEARLRAIEARLREQTARPTDSPSASPVAHNHDFAPATVPFSFADFSWAPGNYSPPDAPLRWGPFNGEIRVDAAYHHSFANPVDDTISGSSEVFRHAEFQLTQLGIGGDFYYKGVHARLMTQFGMYSQTTPRNDSSAARGQWRLDDAYRYISEAYAGYHIDALAGINIQAGIFMSYVGLWSYYNFDNWTYQPSYVSSNTPWFFDGIRVQIHVNDRLKIEPWLVNGWQAYGRFNEAPGFGLQVRWSPAAWFSFVGNQYVGTDTLGVPGRVRMHTDDSVMARLYENSRSALNRAAASLTIDAGCEFGEATGSVTATHCTDQYFIGFMAYARLWFVHDLLAATFGGGAISNPGRYLVLVPPVNGATAFTGTPYFTANPGDPFMAWDLQTTLDLMPTRNLTFRVEYTHRAASVPYFAGHGGVTPPLGNSYVNQGAPGSSVPGWQPDLVNTEDRMTAALLVRL